MNEGAWPRRSEDHPQDRPGRSRTSRVIETIRWERLDHIIPVNERHMRGVLRQFVAYYNETGHINR